MAIVKSKKPVKLKIDTPVMFSHPSIKKKLVINTGMDEIRWPFALNVNIIPTYGGEVQQILSAYVDRMTITGSTTSNDQLKEIYEWFLQYMNVAGLHNRSERAIRFQYPERGWDFWIQVVSLPNYTLGFDKIGTPWSLTAEVVTDNDLNYLVSHTMSVMQDFKFDSSMFNIGFIYDDPRNSPTGFDPGKADNYANNFQSLLGAWATGDFAHWGFDVMADTSTNKLNPDAASYFENMFGTNFISGKPTDTTSGSGVYAGPENPTSQVMIAGMIFDVFESKNMPGILGVATAIIESGLSPNNRGNPASVGLFQPQRPGANSRVNASHGHMTELQQAFNNPQDPVTKYYSVYHQVQDAAGWFDDYKDPPGQALGNWAWRAQGPAESVESYSAKFERAKPQAIALVKEYQKGGGKALQAYLQARKQIGQPYVWGGESRTEGGFDCSGLCQWAYAQVGVSIPRTSQTQQQFGTAISKSQLGPGDLIFQGNPAHHVVMYAGNNQVISAPHTGTVVRMSDATYYINTDSGGYRKMV